ncbi:MAG: hypothetical protein EB100_08090, partial [Crocinitomicaceae bacterium]|nr:hypothetical protein [Crocinitomicaceae bacterium]
MNLNQLSNILKSPALITEQDVQMLKELCNKYPYSQLFSILYLKALHTSKDVYFDDELEKHAYKITDRTKLHQLINERVASDVPIIEVTTSLLEETSTPLAPETTINEVMSPETIHNEEHIEVKATEIELAEEKTVEKEGEIIPEVTTVNEKSLELEILTEAIQTVYQDELENSAEDVIDAKTPITATKQISIEEPLIEVPKITPTTKKKFSDWLNVTITQTNDASIKEEKSKEEIINKFIDTSPKISTPKKEFYSPIKQGQ